MILVQPTAIRLTYKTNEEIIATCSAVCYATEEIKDYKEFCNKRLRSKHYSVFRHGTSYYKIYKYDAPYNVIDAAKYLIDNPLVGYYSTDYYIYLSINHHYLLEHSVLKSRLEKYEVNKDTIIKDGIYDIIRETFILTTQISTSRELNRVSPNNICEESTRYCNYTLDKFGKECKLCVPHWIHVKTGSRQIGFEDINNYNFGVNESSYNKIDTANIVTTYLESCQESFDNYNYLVSRGLKPQDARGLLPIDTATKVAYTYTLKEWRHIINNRVKEITGSSHPNAKLIIGLVKDNLTKLYGDQFIF